MLGKSCHQPCGLSAQICCWGTGLSLLVGMYQADRPADLLRDYSGEGAIDTLLLLDREVDPITPLMTQLTYEGLVDELLGISNGTVQFDVTGGMSCLIILSQRACRS